MTTLTNIDAKSTDQMSVWFEGFVNDINVHFVQLQTGTASKTIENTYSLLMRGNMEEVMQHSKDATDKYFLGAMLYDYLEEISNFDFQKVAVYFNDSSILVWTQIEESNEDLEINFILSEAKVNSKYASKGYSISTTIVETSDNCEIPSHYKLIGE